MEITKKKIFVSFFIGFLFLYIFYGFLIFLFFMVLIFLLLFYDLDGLIGGRIHDKLGLGGLGSGLGPLSEHPVVAVGRVVLHLKLALGLEETLADGKSPVIVCPAKADNSALPSLTGFLVLAGDHANVFDKSELKLLEDVEYLLIRSLGVKTRDVDGRRILLSVDVGSHFKCFISFISFISFCIQLVCVYVLNNPEKVFQFFFWFFGGFLFNLFLFN